MSEWFFALVISLVIAAFIATALLILYLPDACDCQHPVEPVPDSSLVLTLFDGQMVALRSDATGRLMLGDVPAVVRQDGKLALGAGQPVKLVEHADGERDLMVGKHFLYSMDGLVFGKVRTAPKQSASWSQGHGAPSSVLN